MPVKGITPESVEKMGTTRWYTTKRMFWVDPVTGAPVNGQEIHKEELRGGDLLPGGGKVTAFAGHVKMRDDYVDSTVALVTSQRTLVLLLTSYLPWGFLLLGAALLALSLHLEARSRRPHAGAGRPPPGDLPDQCPDVGGPRPRRHPASRPLRPGSAPLEPRRWCAGSARRPKGPPATDAWDSGRATPRARTGIRPSRTRRDRP